MPFKSEKQRRYLFANEPEIAKKWSKEYNMGGVASMFRKRLAEGDDPFYEAWKKIYETNPDAAAMNENHEEYLQKYELEMSMQTSDAPMEETEETTEVVEETADPLLNLFEPTDALASDKAVTTLFTPERPEGIMAAKGGRVALRGGGMDAATTSFSESYDKAVGNPPGTTKGNPELDRLEKEGQDEADRTNRQIEIRQDIKDREEEKYDTNLEGMTDLEKYNARRNMIKTKYYNSDIRVNKITQNRNEEKARLEKKLKRAILPKFIAGVLGLNVTVGLKDLGTLKTSMELAKINKDYKNDLLNEKATVMSTLDLSNPNSMNNPTIAKIDSILETLEKKEDDDKKDKDDPPVEPITLEVDEEYAQGDTLDLNMMSALEKIRKNQAIRSGLVEKGIIQDNEPMLANKGGLAGLFRVRNQ